MTDKKITYFKDGAQSINIKLKNGSSLTGMSEMVPFVVDDFGGTFLRFKDTDDIWHNARIDMIASIQTAPKEFVEKLEQEYLAAQEEAYKASKMFEEEQSE